VLKQFS